MNPCATGCGCAGQLGLVPGVPEQLPARFQAPQDLCLRHPAPSLNHPTAPHQAQGKGRRRPPRPRAQEPVNPQAMGKRGGIQSTQPTWGAGRLAARHGAICKISPPPTAPAGSAGSAAAAVTQSKRRASVLLGSAGQGRALVRQRGKNCCDLQPGTPAAGRQLPPPPKPPAPRTLPYVSCRRGTLSPRPP